MVNGRYVAIKTLGEIYFSIIPPTFNIHSISMKHLNALSEEIILLLGRLSAYTENVPDFELLKTLNTNIGQCIMGCKNITKNNELRDKLVISDLFSTPIEIHSILTTIYTQIYGNARFREMHKPINNSLYLYSPPEHIDSLIKDLAEKYTDSSLPSPILSAIAYAHFEIIQPFNDNEIGLSLLPQLIFINNGLLSYPILNLKNIDESIHAHHLNQLITLGSWDSWISYFLKLLIIALRECCDRWLCSVG